MSNLTYAELVEKVARSIAEANCESFDEMPELHIALARAAISTISDILKEPTEAMKCVGDDQTAFDAANGYPSSAEEIWSLMLAASPLFKEGEAS